MNHAWPSWMTLAICCASGAVQLYWGGQDPQGRFHAEFLLMDGNLGILLFILCPYLLLALSVLFRQNPSLAGLTLTVVLCGIGVLAGWVDHDQYLRTPPERGTPQVLNFLATLFLWPASVIALTAIGISHIAHRRSSRPREPVSDPAQ